MRDAVSVSFAVQHHPDRRGILVPLLAALDGAAEVVEDPDPTAKRRSPWRCHRHVLETTPEWATHRVVLQDDVVPIPGFTRIAARALTVMSDRPVAFFVAGQPGESAAAVLRAGQRRRSWAVLPPDRYVPCPALAWPVELIAPVLEWIDGQKWRDEHTADDEILSRAFSALKIRVMATVPSLVEHPDKVPSTLGKRVSGGRSPNRVACCPPPEGCDLDECDWSDGPL